MKNDNLEGLRKIVINKKKELQMIEEQLIFFETHLQKECLHDKIRRDHINNDCNDSEDSRRVFSDYITRLECKFCKLVGNSNDEDQQTFNMLNTKFHNKLKENK